MQPQTLTAPTNSKAPRRRWPWITLTLFALSLLLLAGGYGLLAWSASRDTESALAETDRLDPKWRVADLEAAREALNPEENSAVQVVKAVGLARGNARVWRKDFGLQFDKLEAPYELNPLQIEMLQEAQEGLEEALAEARKLTDMPKGRHNLKVSVEWISTNLSDQQNTRRAFELLQHDAWLRAQMGDCDGAVASCRALMNAARSLGDEPFLISFFIRVAGDHMALHTLERVLAQGKLPSEKALAAMQALIEQEMVDVQRHWVNAMRGERAGQQHLIQAIADGKFKIGQIGGMINADSSVGDKVAGFFPVLITSGYPMLLRHMNQVVEASKLPLEQQYDRMQELEKEIPRSTVLARLLAPAVQKVTLANLRTQTLLRSAQVAVAAERFRIKRDDWPKQLADLVKAGVIEAVPLDPFDGAELRWRRFAEGMAAYGVGVDRIDDGGNIDIHRAHEKGFDVGLKVWDVGRRRQAAQPPVVEGDGLPPGR